MFKFPIIVIIQEVDNGHFDALIGGCAFVVPVQGGKVHYWEDQPGCSLSQVVPQLNAIGSA